MIKDEFADANRICFHKNIIKQAWDSGILLQPVVEAVEVRSVGADY